MLTLKEARMKAGVSPAQSAVACDVSSQTIYNWEQGLSTPKKPYIQILCNLYGVDESQLKLNKKKK